MKQKQQNNLRRFDRFPVQLAVRLKSKNGHKQLVTANISRSGLFIRSDSPPPERQLIQLTVDLGEQGLLNVVGMVVHCFAPGDPHPEAPGMGVEYFAMSKDDKKIWDRFCLEQDRQSREAVSILEPVHDSQNDDLPVVIALPEGYKPGPELRGQAVLPPAETPTAVKHQVKKNKTRLVTLKATPHLRRQSRRFAAVFAAHVKDQKELQEFLTRDISIGGTFLRCDTLIPIDSQLELVLIHPQSKQEYEIVATVVHSSQGGPGSARGLGVSFAPLSERAQAEFENFVRSGVRAQNAPPVDEEEIVLLENIVEFDAKTPRAHTNIARIYIEQLHDPEAAIDELQKVLQESPDYVPAHRLLQLAYALTGENEKAYEHIHVVMQLRGGLGLAD